MNTEDYQEPIESLTKTEWIITAVIMVLLGLEFAYMWEWCQWFTNCPKT